MSQETIVDGSEKRKPVRKGHTQEGTGQDTGERSQSSDYKELNVVLESRLGVSETQLRIRI